MSVLFTGCTSHATTLSEIKTLQVCGVKLRAEVARSETDRSRGLMGRTELAAGNAMLFVFEEERPLSFWMKNVPFAIDIGFFDSHGLYVSHTTMAGTSPLQREATLPSYPSSGPAKYAVEVPQGFFSKVKTKNCRLTPQL